MKPSHNGDSGLAFLILAWFAWVTSSLWMPLFRGLCHLSDECGLILLALPQNPWAFFDGHIAIELVIEWIETYGPWLLIIAGVWILGVNLYEVLTKESVRKACVYRDASPIEKLDIDIADVQDRIASGLASKDELAELKRRRAALVSE